MWKFILTVAALASSITTSAVTVIEYYNSTLDAYFITGRTTEQTLLDTAPGFRRTGMTFQAVAATSGAFTRICRFYVSQANPFASSHFYGKEGVDCESIRLQNPPGFTWEDYDFAVAKLNADNTCPSGNTPLFRGFRAAANGKTPNHRYYPSRASCDAGTAAGYVCEGQSFCGGSGVAPPPPIAAARTYRGTFHGGQQDIVFTGTVTWSLRENERGPNGEPIYRITAASANLTGPAECSNPGVVALDTTSAFLSVTPGNASVSNQGVTYGGLLGSVPVPISCPNPPAPPAVVPFAYIWTTCLTEDNVMQNQFSASAARLQGSCNANDGASFAWDYQAVD